MKDGFKPDANNTNWTGQNNAVQAYGKATLPWLVVKMTPVVDLASGTTVKATVKLDGTEIGQLTNKTTAANNQTLTVDSNGLTAGTSKTFHWEMGKCTENTSWQLNQPDGPQSGTYTVSFEVKKGNDEMKSPDPATVEYKAPTLAKKPTEGTDTLIYSSTDVGNGKTNLKSGVQEFTVEGNKIIVSSAYDMKTYGECTYAGLKIAGSTGAWFNNTNNKYTHFVVVEFVNPYETGTIGYYRAKTAGNLSGAVGTVGAGDAAVMIFAFNATTKETSAPVRLAFSNDGNSFGTEWKLDLDFSAIPAPAN